MPLSDFSFTILDSVDSTNNYAMARVHAGLAKQGDAFFAHAQTNGKGQRGKLWQTGQGENIAISIVLEPEPLQQQEQFYLSISIALACFDFFNKYAGDETKIKWPNDLYWRDRKAGGVLIETVLRGNNWKWAVVGIGININQGEFSEELKNPVSLKQITGKNFDVVELAKELHLLVMKRVSEINEKSFAVLLKDYNSLLYKLNEKVTLKHNNEIFETVINSVTAGGQLQVTDTIQKQFNFGEVEFLIA
ncbi:MAG TPA: biotin--[acetyl-CoA-carboxylase] ligase [Ferruginibacter sp.]|jgi:BirA family biotin operon repressor/biotin-[acetyl-CoA-carboxylase] ligase|nr:biotin--[acetyl-CoA-carboxylase] ligase [Ferruginibacter sp.]